MPEGTQRAEPDSVACPTCPAKKGRGCVNERGGYSIYHRERFRLAEKGVEYVYIRLYQAICHRCKPPVSLPIDSVPFDSVEDRDAYIRVHMRENHA